MVENTLVGVPVDQIAATMVERGIEASVARDAIAGMRQDPFYEAARHLSQRYRKLESILEIRRSLTDLTYNAASVERRTKTTASEFLERYYSVNRPVIFTGLMNGSAAAERWTPEYLTQQCGEAMVQIMAGRQADPFYEPNAATHKREVRMSDFVRMVLEGGETNDYYLVGNNYFFGRPEAQALFSEVPQFPEYLDWSRADGNVFFWFGPAGTVTPLHHDVMNILVAQIFGKKQFTLIPPEQTPHVYNNRGVYAEVDCEEPDDSRHPLYRRATPIDVEIGPGEVLFIPVGWWHYVKALDVSIMVSYVNFRFPNTYDWFHPDIRPLSA